MFAVYIEFKDNSIGIDKAIVTFDKSQNANRYVRWLRTNPEYKEKNMDFCVDIYQAPRHNPGLDLWPV